MGESGNSGTENNKSKCEHHLLGDNVVPIDKNVVCLEKHINRFLTLPDDDQQVKLLTSNYCITLREKLQAQK